MAHLNTTTSADAAQWLEGLEREFNAAGQSDEASQKMQEKIDRRAQLLIDRALGLRPKKVPARTA